MNYMPQMDRRSFLVGTAAAGLSLGFQIPVGGEARATEDSNSTMIEMRFMG